MISDSLYLIQAGAGETADVFRLTTASTPTMTNLTESAGVSEFWPVPSPDGKRVAFYAVRSGVQNSLQILQPDGSVLDLTYRSSTSGLGDEYEIDLNQPPIWSPYCTWLAFLAQQVGEEQRAIELFIARSDGTEVRKLTSNGNCVMNPVWLAETDLAYVEIRGNGKAIVYKVSIEQPSLTPEALTDEFILPK
jgi:Tol biopolymer transport system component